jgi:hypothetical protein
MQILAHCTVVNSEKKLHVRGGQKVVWIETEWINIFLLDLFLFFSFFQLFYLFIILRGREWSVLFNDTIC